MTDVDLQWHGSVALVTLDRPEVLNAVRTSTMQELRAAFAVIADRADARAVVITGRGRAFCAGQDMNELEMLSREEHLDRPALLRDFQQVTLDLAALEVPTIAAINGVAVGFGAELAINCDIRLAHRTARIGFVEVTRAVFPTNGITWLLPRLVGHGRAMELLLGGEMIDMSTAASIGLVNQVVDADVVPAALELATRWAEHAPLSMRGVKAAMRATWSATLAEMMDVETAGMLACYDTADLDESTAAFLAKRPPRYLGR